LLFSWLSLSPFRKVQSVLTLRGSISHPLPPTSIQIGCVYISICLTDWLICHW
jgi:hypothetical protein